MTHLSNSHKGCFYSRSICENNKKLKYDKTVNPLSANPEKWSNTLKQIVGNLPTICLSVFDHFMNLVLKELMRIPSIIYR